MTAPDSTEARNGVSAHQGAGTPFPLGPEACADALEVLEFARVLEQVAGYAAGPAGAARVRARLPSADVAWIRAELGPVAELVVLLGRGDPVTAFAVPELAGVLSRLRLDGSVLEGLELAAVHRTLSAARQTGTELKRIAGEAPLAAALRVTPLESALEKRLAESVDEAGELLDSASPALLRARREVHAARERLVRKLQAMLHRLDPSAGGRRGRGY